MLCQINSGHLAIFAGTQVTDFGLSAIVKPGQLLKVACGTPAYSAPEVLARQEYDGKLLDVWSLGVLLYQMAHGKLPFNNIAQIRAGDFAVAPNAMSTGAHDLLRRILVVNPKMRLPLAEVSSNIFYALEQVCCYLSTCC